MKKSHKIEYYFGVLLCIFLFCNLLGVITIGLDNKLEGKDILDPGKSAHESLEKIPEEFKLTEDKAIEQKQHEIGRCDGHEVDHHLDPQVGGFRYPQQGIEGDLHKQGGGPGNGEYPEDQPELEVAFNAPLFL